MAQQVGCLAMQETQGMQVKWLGQKDSPQEEMANHFSIPCLGNPMTEEFKATVHGLAKSLI